MTSANAAPVAQKRTGREKQEEPFIIQATSEKPGEGSFTVTKATRKDALETATGLLGQGISRVTIIGDGRIYTVPEFAKTPQATHEAELGTEDGMAQVKSDDEAYEDRLVILEDLGIEENALEHDESTDEVSASTDEAAVRRFFARAFQEWANGNVEGTAEEIFDAVVTLLDSDD